MTRRCQRLAVTLCLLVGAACSDDHESPAHPVGDGSTTTPAASTPTSGLAATRVRVTRIAAVPSPTAIVARAGTDDLYVASQGGTVSVLRRRPDASFAAPATVLDLTDRVGEAGGERGLLGIAFSPAGDRLVVSYTDGNDKGASVLERYDVRGDTVEASSRLELLRVRQPFANHNGGNVVFGPDGYLWFGLGDGGSQGDPNDNGQDPSTLLATIMRIDPLRAGATTPYAIPADNPFADGARGRPEVWLYGVRNPWRFSFDAATGDLWIGDVGGGEWEEIDLLPAPGRGRGANLGWSLREGAHDTDKDGERPPGLVEPVFEYDHSQGSAITGGVVYRGTAIPALAGVYLYSDSGTSTLRALRMQGTTVSESATLPTTGERFDVVVSFGTDRQGEVYAAELGGFVVRLDPA